MTGYATVRAWCDARDLVRALWPLWSSVAFGAGFGVVWLLARLLERKLP